MSSINSIVDLLKRASDAYYNGKNPIMDDDTFDALLDELRSKDPNNPFIKTVGAEPNEGAVTLPSYMPSLEKIKPGEPTLTRFLRLSKYYVLSEKLDGLSALWCPATKSLYLRGNGLTGQTISHLVDRIDSLVPSNEPWLIRGELVLAKDAVGLGSTPARTVINGLVHKSNPDLQLLKQVKFIAYEVINPASMKRSDQFTWLKSNGFLVPWWILKDSPREDDLKTFFTERRTSSVYDTDGIVIGIDNIPYKAPMTATQSAPKPPKDCVAFKMPVSDQSAITTVEEVLWAPSAQGYLIPRIRIKPVQIGGAVIEFCTGHNARTIVDKGIGCGAQIKIRRSGDVIPTLDQILIPATVTMPTKYEWEWVGTDATHIKLVGNSTDQLASQLHLFAKTIDIPGLGPANCKALVDADITGPAILWSKTVDELSKILGPKTGATLYANLRTKLLSPALTELELLIASNKMPRGTGESKLKSLLITEPNIKNWPTLTVVPQGWIQESLQAFQKSFPEYETWRTNELHFIPYPLKASSNSNDPLKTVCFTGFRDKTLEEKIKSTFQVVATVSSKLNILVVPDDSNHESEKVKKARTLGTIEVLQCSDFIKKYII
jgi:NAD-dependent DNA ligase